MKQKTIEELYRFACICCGDCCTGDMTINVNLYDLFKIACRLEMESTEELFDKGLFTLVKGQNEALIPRIKFRTRPFKFCPWLINDMGDEGILRGYCSLHPHDKPLVCKMAPVGRIADMSLKSETFVLTEPTEQCPGMNSLKENRLSDLKKELKNELDYELRYFAILERMSGLPEDQRRKFYFLDCAVSFEDQLRERENLFES